MTWHIDSKKTLANRQGFFIVFIPPFHYVRFKRRVMPYLLRDLPHSSYGDHMRGQSCARPSLIEPGPVREDWGERQKVPFNL